MDATPRIGLGSATLLVVASMIGAGVFTTSGFALADLGSRPLVLAAWAVGGVVALCGTLCYAALARRFPDSGGEYTFLSRTTHPAAGFLAGWVSLLAGFTAPLAFAALALEVYLGSALRVEVPHGSVALGSLALAFVLHGWRRGAGLALQNAAVVLKLALLAGLALLAAWRLEPSAASSTGATGGVGAFAVSLVWISLAYSGWNATIYVAGEVRDAERNAGRSLLLGCGAVTLTYLVLNAIFLYAAPPGELAGQADVALVAARALGGEGAARVVGAVVGLALFTSVSALMLAGPRVYARMAADGLFPQRLAFRGDVPTAAVAFQALLAAVAVLRSDLKDLLDYTSFTLGVSSAATIAGLVALRRREGAARVAVRGWPLTPLVYLTLTLGSSAYFVVRDPAAAGWGALTVAAGLPLYLAFGRRRAR
ncbi:MAG: amino acid permease [Planctomycetes bacterium]|nr:amino acid permease [Planctomycetota bacterium]